jgi:transcriptional regulator with XRE-family HTH domain
VTTPKRSRTPVPLDVVIGRAIRHLRRKRGLSQRMLATRLGVSVERVRQLESAATPMRPRTLIRLATVLEAPLSAFFRNYRRRRPLGVVAATAATYSREQPAGAALRPLVPHVS